MFVLLNSYNFANASAFPNTAALASLGFAHVGSASSFAITAGTGLVASITSTNEYDTDYLELPAANSARDAQIVVAGTGFGTNGQAVAYARVQSNGDNYFAFAHNANGGTANLYVYRAVGGTLTQVATVPITSMVAGNAWTLSFGVVGVSPATATAIFTDTVAGTVTTASGTDSGGPTAAGLMAFSVGTPTSGVTFTAASAYSGDGPTAIALSGATTGTVGTASGTITATLDKAALLGGQAVALSVATIAGTFNPASPLAIAQGQTSATFTFDPSAAGSGTITAASSGVASGTLGFTASAGAPAAPGSPSATAGNASVALAWSASSGATSYSIFRGTTAGGESGTALATGVTGTTYADATAANGTTYYYTIKAVNAGGTSAASAEVSATPVAAATITTLVASPTSGYAGVATTLTVGSNGTYSGTKTGTLTDGGANGAFNPTTVPAIASGATATIQYTPPVATTSATITLGATLSGLAAGSANYAAIADTLAAIPAIVETGSTTTITFTDPAGLFPSSPQIAMSTLAGASLGAITKVNATTATAPVTTGTATGTLAFTDMTTGATASVAVAATTVYLTSASGLTPGSTSVAVQPYAGSPATAFGAAITISTGVQELPAGSGNFQAQIAIPAGVLPSFSWGDGVNGPVLDTDWRTVAVAGSGSGGSVDVATIGGVAVAVPSSGTIAFPNLVSNYSGGVVAGVTNPVDVTLTSLALDGGTVVSVPAPSTSTFSASGSNLTATQSGAYNGSSVIFQATSAMGRVKRVVTSHSFVPGSPARHDFVVVTTSGSTPTVAPASGDTFFLG